MKDGLTQRNIHINENDFAIYFVAKTGLFKKFKMYYLIELDRGLMDLFPF